MIFNPIYITYGLFALVVILIGWVIRLEVKIKKLLIGKDAKSLEDSIVNANANLEKMENFQKEAALYFKNIEKKTKEKPPDCRNTTLQPFQGYWRWWKPKFLYCISIRKW